MNMKTTCFLLFSHVFATQVSSVKTTDTGLMVDSGGFALAEEH